jgi:hypothetical protein
MPTDGNLTPTRPVHRSSDSTERERLGHNRVLSCHDLPPFAGVVENAITLARSTMSWRHLIDVI